MVTAVVQSDFRSTGGNVVRTATERFTAAGSMGWTRFEDTNVIAAISGTATTGTVIVERSAVDPGLPNGAAITPVDDTSFSGDLTTGVTPRVYIESGVGWWRIRVTVSTAGYVDCALSGQGG